MNKQLILFFSSITRMIFDWYWKLYDTEIAFENNKILRIFINILFSGFNILKVIFKSNSVSINKKNHINIKCSLLNKTLHSVKSEIFSIKEENLPNSIQLLSFLHTIKVKYNYSEITYRVLGYWNWFAELFEKFKYVAYLKMYFIYISLMKS